MAERQYWIGVVARDQVKLATKAGVAQLNTGSKEPLTTMQAGDGILFYSPRDTFPGGKPAQTFTGIGRVKTGQVHEEPGGPNDFPFRLEIDFFKARETPIRPLIDALTFIEDKTHWGFPFRVGYVNIPEEDFKRIAAAMGVDFEKVFGEGM